MIGLAISLDVVSSRTGISIDNSAHLGGVLCGLLFAAPMVPRIGNPKTVFQTRLQIAVGMIVGILVLFGFFTSRRVLELRLGAELRPDWQNVATIEDERGSSIHPVSKELTMERREFLKQAAVTAAAVAASSQMQAKTPANPIPKRTLGRTGEQLSIIAFGGIVVMDESTGNRRTLWPRRWIAGSTTSMLRRAMAMRRSGWARRWLRIGRIAFWRARPRAA